MSNGGPITRWGRAVSKIVVDRSFSSVSFHTYCPQKKASCRWSESCVTESQLWQQEPFFLGGWASCRLSGKQNLRSMVQCNIYHQCRCALACQTTLADMEQRDPEFTQSSNEKLLTSKYNKQRHSHPHRFAWRCSGRTPLQSRR